MRPSLGRRVVAEGLGTAFLLAAVVGSGIMGERLAGGNVALALLPNALATGAVLLALLLTFGKVSGAHFNPVVSLASIDADFPWEEAAIYVVAQVTGPSGRRRSQAAPGAADSRCGAVHAGHHQNL